MNETNTHIVITMEPEWSARVDGAKLFTAIGALSGKLKLRLKDKKIEVILEKKGKYLDLLMKAAALLEEADQTMMRKDKI